MSISDEEWAAIVTYIDVKVYPHTNPPIDEIEAKMYEDNIKEAIEHINILRNS